jgi:hypothetical protein
MREKSEILYLIPNRKREETQRYAMELYNKGLENQARQKLIESIDIDPKMAYNFIKVKDNLIIYLCI